MIDQSAQRRTAIALTSEREDDVRSQSRPIRLGTFWSRHSTIINFWLDLVLLIIFVIQGWMIAVLRFVFPRGAGPEWKVWGATFLDWTEALGLTFAVFSVGILVHVMFHWAWICGVVSTKLLGRKATKDDGSQTLIGVALIVFLVHLVIGGMLIARLGLVALGKDLKMAQLLRNTFAAGVLGLCSVAVVLLTRGSAMSQDANESKKKSAPDAAVKKDGDLAKFMRKKLDASNQILEGLVTEDADLVVKGATALSELSGAEKFQIHHDVMYKQFSSDFQKAAKTLVESAKKENFDGATLKWIDVTMKCIECHKFVRGLRIAN